MMSKKKYPSALPPRGQRNALVPAVYAGPGLQVRQSFCGHVNDVYPHPLGTSGLGSCVPVGVLCANGRALAHFDTRFSTWGELIASMLDRVSSMLSQCTALYGNVLVVNIGTYNHQSASVLSAAIDYVVRSQICRPYLQNATIFNTNAAGLNNCDALFMPDGRLIMAETIPAIRDWPEAPSFSIQDALDMYGV